MPDRVLGHVEAIAATLVAGRLDLVGVYLHGSAVLGGFDPARSDVDVLAVVAGPEGESAQRRTGEAIAATGARCPGAGLELSVLTAATARELGDCPFEVHVNTTGAEPVIVPGAGAGGDPDLVLHAAVCREFGRAVLGPPPGEVFGRPPRQRILAAMVADLRWAIDGGHAAYAVLNACRAARFAEEGRICSKLDGAHWYLARHPDDATVTAALARHLGGGPGPSGERARAFVEGSGISGWAEQGG
ncbi:aminoglycoside adenylyltransferase domain-containing protein [Streptomyces sp. NPDC127098]|uniref:aminoglycoside adenylyltransferase domain-containing protein n=1 Tax=Streptomyces sp. NPDC127098 TaxID=3347137 RepID=UPI0036565FC3